MGLFRKKESKEPVQQQENNTPVTEVQKLLEEFKSFDNRRNSNQFKNVKNTLELIALNTDPKEKKELNEKFGQYCRDFLQMRENATDQSTKQKVSLVEKALGYQRFTACEIAYSQIKSMDNEMVSLESAMRITKYSKKFQDAYEAFRKCPDKTAVDIDSRNQMQQQYEEHLEINVDAVRSMPKLEEALLQNKPWGQISFPVPIVQTMNNAERVGGALSSRSVVEINGKKGVFSEYSETSMEAVIQNAISALPPGEAQNALGNHFDDIVTLSNEKLKFIRTSNDKETSIIYGKEYLYKFVEEKLEKGNLEEQKEKYKDLLDAMEKEEFDQAMGFLIEQAQSFRTIESNFDMRGLALEKGNLDKRNELTSRMAEALGLGYMVAHSERVKMVRNGKIIEGNFMEFAEGFDVRKKDLDTARTYQKVSFDDPGFKRDANRIQLFDFLCGQTDRHDANLIYTLGDPDDEGIRRITGFKGIDNDGSFPTKNSEEIFNNKSKTQKTQHIKDMAGVDIDLAEKIMELDREKLDFFLGDVLDKESIDKTEERLKEMKTHFISDKCKLIKAEDWVENTPVVEKLQNAEVGPIPNIRSGQRSTFEPSPEDERKKQQSIEGINNAMKRARARCFEKTGRDMPEKETVDEKDAKTRFRTSFLKLETDEFNEIRNRKADFHQQRANAPQRTREVQEQVRVK